MKWDKANKKRLQKLLEAKLQEIATPLFPSGGVHALVQKNPKITMNDILIQLAPNFKARDAQYDQFFADFGIECAPCLTKTQDRVILETRDISAALKGTKLSIPKDIALKFLLLGMP